MDMIFVVVTFIILAVLCWYYLYDCVEQRKFYREHAKEKYGRVITWDKHIQDKGQYKETYYDMDISTENGETYHISTPNRKARRYKNKKDIIIVVPDSVKSETDFPYLCELNEKERNGSLTALESEKLKRLREIEELQSQLDEVAKQLTAETVVIKEDVRPIRHIVASVIMGSMFSILTVIAIIAMVSGV